MRSEFDCIIVGARCAGAPLAMHLTRAGMRVLLLEGKKLHTDQPFSTHAIQSVGMELLDEIGVGDAVRAVTPKVTGARLEVRGHAFDVPLPERRPMYCPRRSTLDPLLQNAALQAGVEIREETRVTGLLREGDSVCGVEAVHRGQTQRYRARWVVGADGRNSTVARLAGSKDYIQHDAERGGYWAYWPKPACWDADEPYRRFQTVISIDDTARFAFECDAGLLIIGALPAGAEARSWGKDHARALRRALLASELTAPLVQGEPIGPPVGLLQGRFFFREPVGPGWALVGDAGLHKDPTPGHGITDALRDAKALAQALVDGRPAALEVYWRARDVASVPLYFQGIDMGRLAFANPFNELVMDGMNRAGDEALQRMHEILHRERSPFDLAPSGWVLRWLGAALLRGRFDVLAPFLSSARFSVEVEREFRKRKQLLAQAEASLTAA